MASDEHSNDDSAFPPPPEADDGAGAAPGAAPEAAAAAAGAASAADSAAGAQSAGAAGQPGIGGASVPPPPAGAPVSGISQEDRTMALLCHLSGVLLFLVPVANVIVPLVLWLIKKDTSAFVDHHGKEALNFQINVTFWATLFALLSIVLIGIPFLLLLIIADVVLFIVATVKASSGEQYSYPLTLRLVR